jgi:hypothetical protein
MISKANIEYTIQIWKEGNQFNATRCYKFRLHIRESERSLR